MATILRPNLVTIDRRIKGSPGPTGSTPFTVSTLNSGVPAHIDVAESGQDQWLITGEVYKQLAMVIIDGLAPARFFSVTPGDTVVVNGITYTVTLNGLGAFPDVADGDRITDEKGTEFLVIAVARYNVTRQLQAQIVKGKAWT